MVMAGKLAASEVAALKCLHGLGEGWGYDWLRDVVCLCVLVGAKRMGG